jgi:hypothetical protein
MFFGGSGSCGNGAASVLPYSGRDDTKFVPPGRELGELLIMTEFCAQFAILHAIKTCLEENGHKDTFAFYIMVVQDLKDLSRLRLGDNTRIRSPVGTWS